MLFFLSHIFLPSFRLRLLISFVLFSYLSKAQIEYTFSTSLQESYQNIIALKLNKAQQTLSKESQSVAIKIYLQNYADMVTLLVSDNKQLFEQLSSRQDTRLNVLENLPQNSPYARFLQAEVRLHWAFVKLKFGKELSGAWDIIKAYKLLDENAKKYPQFMPTYKSLGLLHVLIGATPQNYKWVTRVLGLRGNIQQGMQEIKLANQHNKIWQVESKLVEILLYAYVLKYSSQQNNELIDLLKNNPDNLLLYFFGTTVSMKDGRGQQALQILSEAPTGTIYLSFPFLNYLKAELLLQKGQYDQARNSLKIFLSQYKGQNFLKDTYFKIFLTHWLKDEDTTAILYINLILQKGIPYVEADKNAQKFAENFQKQNISALQKPLMKARLAFDGGYLVEATEILKTISENKLSSIADKAEYYYRQGRIYQRQYKTNESIENYLKTIELSQPQQLSFGAMAALQLGYIYQEKRQLNKAIYYFRIVLNYPKHEYKNSLDNKARAALTEMGFE